MKTKLIVASIVLSLGAPAAMAENFYVFGAVGQSKAKDMNKEEFDGKLAGAGASLRSSSLDDKSTAPKLQLGYQFNEYFALEGGYFSLGKASYGATIIGGKAKATYKAEGWSLSAIGSLPLSNRFAVFGKVGAIQSTAKLSAVVDFGAWGSSSENEKASKGGVVYGVGAAYDITKSVAVRAEYEVYDKVGNEDIGKSKVDALSMGVAYKF